MFLNSNDIFHSSSWKCMQHQREPTSLLKMSRLTRDYHRYSFLIHTYSLGTGIYSNIQTYIYRFTFIYIYIYLYIYIYIYIYIGCSFGERGTLNSHAHTLSFFRSSSASLYLLWMECSLFHAVAAYPV